MNCKEGDLAIVVKSVCGNEGKIVTCLELIKDVEWLNETRIIRIAPGWIVDIELIGADGSRDNLIADSALRPIRGQPGEDEKLTLAGLPASHKETA